MTDTPDRRGWCATDAAGAQAHAAPVAASATQQRQLASAEAALQEIAHRLAHDLRTALRHVISYAELLQEGLAQAPPLERPQVVARADKVRHAAQRLAHGLNDLSALARIGCAPMHGAVLDMEALVRAAWNGLELGEGGAGLTVQPPLPRAWGDAPLLEQFWRLQLQALCRSASRTGVPGVVRVSGRPAAGGLQFELQWVPAPPDVALPPGVFPTLAPGHGRAHAEAAHVDALAQRLLGCHGGHSTPLRDDGPPSRGFWLPLPPVFT